MLVANPVFKCTKYDLNSIFDLTRKLLSEDFDHGLPHVLRVLNIAYGIVEKTKIPINYCVLEVAVLLHDIGRALGEPHAYYSALLAESLLREKGFTDNEIKCIVNAILYHSYSYSRRHHVKPVCEEAKILSDADKLDALGVIGFVRVFLYDKKRNIKDILRHFNEKILKLPDLMHYSYTREKAEFLRERVKTLLNWLDEELEVGGDR